MRNAKTAWQTREDIKFLTVNGVQFRYRERGAGRSIVFAADPPATLELYDQLFDVFAPEFHVIALELPAMGFRWQRADSISASQP